jgi:hypothetical protein
MIAFALLALAFSGDEVPAARPAPLVVHEWGTFTSAQNPRGDVLDGMHHEEESLPPFVYQMDDARAVDLQMLRTKGLARSVRGVTVKMETPVTYFYSGFPALVRARVELKHGLLSQWYPFARVSEKGTGNGQAYERGENEERAWVDFRTVESGALEWDVELLAPGLGDEAFPKTEPDAQWNAARIPGANRVRALVAAEGDAPAREETEGFLFYRGLARFALPITARTGEGAHVRLENTSAVGDVLTHLWVLHARDGRADVAYFPRLEPGQRVEFELPLTEASPARNEIEPKLALGLEGSLVNSGLTRDEAHAMVETWRKSYFRTDGLRVLYVLPQRFTDEVLPLSIEPRPRECVRVLVGRLEIVTPEVEREVEQGLHDFAHGNDAQRQLAWKRISKHERLLEPILRSVHERIVDAATRDVVAGWLGELN